MSLRNKLQTTAGFTLVEALVSSVVFVVVLTATISLLMIFLQGPLQQIQQKQLEEQMSYVVNEVTRYVHTNKIDYSKYNPATVTNPVPTLYLVSLTGQTMSINLNSNVVQLTQATNTFPLTTSNNVIVIDALQFYLYPLKDPAVTQPSAVNDTNNQPAVLLYVKGHKSDNPKIKTQYQTIITSRYYAR